MEVRNGNPGNPQGICICGQPYFLHLLPSSQDGPHAANPTRAAPAVNSDPTTSRLGSPSRTQVSWKLIAILSRLIWVRVSRSVLTHRQSRHLDLGPRLDPSASLLYRLSTATPSSHRGTHRLLCLRPRLSPEPVQHLVALNVLEYLRVQPQRPPPRCNNGLQQTSAVTGDHTESIVRLRRFLALVAPPHLDHEHVRQDLAAKPCRCGATSFASILKT